MRFEILRGDCVAMMGLFVPDSSVDAIVCDPPYELGFMGKTWDNSGVAFRVETWAECLRVLKPGGHLLAFSGSRTYHRMVCAIEDAGFEIRDQIMWVYGSGFPKSLDVSKAIDKDAGHWRGRAGAIESNNGAMSSGNYERTPKGDPVTAAAATWQGWGTALKPAHEPIVVARKPLIGTVASNVLAHGTGALNVDGCRVATDGEVISTPQSDPNKRVGAVGATAFVTQRDADAMKEAQRASVERANTMGRWPANLIHDGSDDVLAAFPTVANASAARFFYAAKASKRDRNEGCEALPTKAIGSLNMRSDSHAERNGNLPEERANTHPTVKPTDLMRYLCRLVTPPGGLVFDPFTGSGSTGKAAMLEGFRFMGCEMSDEYADIAEARIGHAAFGDVA